MGLTRGHSYFCFSLMACFEGLWFLFGSTGGQLELAKSVAGSTNDRDGESANQSSGITAALNDFIFDGNGQTIDGNSQTIDADSMLHVRSSLDHVASHSDPLCRMCGEVIYGVVCDGPLSQRVHYGCAQLQCKAIRSTAENRFNQRTKQREHTERWDKIRCRKQKRRWHRQPLFASGRDSASGSTQGGSAKAQAPANPFTMFPQNRQEEAGSHNGDRESHWFGMTPSSPSAVTCFASVRKMLSDALIARQLRLDEAIAAAAAEEVLHWCPDPDETEHRESCSRSLCKVWEGVLAGASEWFHRLSLSCSSFDTTPKKYSKKLLQQGSRGAHLARIAAAKRGAKLVKWKDVRRQCINSSICSQVWSTIVTTLDRMAKTMCSVRDTLCSWWPGIPSRPSSSHYGKNASVAMQRCQRTTHRLAQGAFFVCCWHRLLHAIMFACALLMAQHCFPTALALPLGYLFVKGLTLRSDRCHTTQCRVMTASAVAIISGLIFGIVWAVAGLVFLSTCPRTWLWWPVARMLKRPASCDAATYASRKIVIKRPAHAKQSVEKRKSQEVEHVER